MNFIWMKENALSDDMCNAIIADAEKTIEYDHDLQVTNHSKSRDLPTHRDDIQLFVPETLGNYYNDIRKAVYIGLREYANQEASQLAIQSGLNIGVCKFQKTKKNAIGFAHFHAEQGPGEASSRVVVWTIYLNDVTEGGETEFPVQGVRVQPKKGALCLFPAGYTHLHRGNPPYSNDKYILTGWLSYPANREHEEIFGSAEIQF